MTLTELHFFALTESFLGKNDKFEKCYSSPCMTAFERFSIDLIKRHFEISKRERGQPAEHDNEPFKGILSPKSNHLLWVEVRISDVS